MELVELDIWDGIWLMNHCLPAQEMPKVLWSLVESWSLQAQEVRERVPRRCFQVATGVAKIQCVNPWTEPSTLCEINERCIFLPCGVKMFAFARFHCACSISGESLYPAPWFSTSVVHSQSGGDRSRSQGMCKHAKRPPKATSTFWQWPLSPRATQHMLCKEVLKLANGFVTLVWLQCLRGDSGDQPALKWLQMSVFFCKEDTPRLESMLKPWLIKWIIVASEGEKVELQLWSIRFSWLYAYVDIKPSLHQVTKGVITYQ